MQNEVSPDHILQVGMGFWASKTLLSAVELGLFTELGESSRSGAELEKALELHPRATYDFLDTLVALGFLKRDGDGPDGRYRNTPRRPRFSTGKARRMSAASSKWPTRASTASGPTSLTALRTGQPQNEIKHSGKPMFAELYSRAGAARAVHGRNDRHLRGQFPGVRREVRFLAYKTLCDIGGATGQLRMLRRAPTSASVAALRYDLPAVAAHRRTARSRQRASPTASSARIDRFFRGRRCPKADVITMGMILHDWNLRKKMHLIAKGLRGRCREGGAFVVIENLIDDARRRERVRADDVAQHADRVRRRVRLHRRRFPSWCREAGFARCEIIPLAGPASAAIAYK